MSHGRIDVLYAVPGSEELVARALDGWTGSGSWMGRFVDPGRLDRLVIVQVGSDSMLPPPLEGAPLLGGLGETFAGPAAVAGEPQASEAASLSVWDGPGEELEIPAGAFALIVHGEELTAAFVTGPPSVANLNPRWTYLLTSW